MGLAQRFTDRHLRRYPGLLAIAVEYARGYDGDFEPVLDAQASVQKLGTLPLPVARLVLNCLRADADPWVTSLALEADSYLLEEKASQPEPKPRLRVVREPERSRSVRTGVRLHLPYGRSRQGNPDRRVIHRVADAWCEWRKWDYNRDRWLDRPAPELQVTWVHGSYSARGVELLGEVSPEDRLCRSGCWPTERLTFQVDNGRWIAEDG